MEIEWNLKHWITHKTPAFMQQNAHFVYTEYCPVIFTQNLNCSSRFSDLFFTNFNLFRITLTKEWTNNNSQCVVVSIRLKFVVVIICVFASEYCIVHIVDCFRYPATAKHFNCSMDARRLRVSIVYTLHYPKFISCAPYKTLASLYCAVLCVSGLRSVWPEYTKGEEWKQWH